MSRSAAWALGSRVCIRAAEGLVAAGAWCAWRAVAAARRSSWHERALSREGAAWLPSDVVIRDGEGRVAARYRPAWAPHLRGG